MKLQDKDLQEIFLQALKENFPRNKACPSNKTILRSFTSEMPEKEKLKIVDHVTGCGSCLLKFQAIKDVLRGTKALACKVEGQVLSKNEVGELKKIAKEKVKELKRKTKKQKRIPGFTALLFEHRFAALIAGMVLVILAALLVTRFPHIFQEDATRGEESPAIRLVSPRGELGSLPLRFHWEPYPGAKEYEMKILDEELNPIWKSGKVRESAIETVADFSNRLQKGKMYYWKITVYLEDGKLEESNLQEFMIVD